MKVRSTVSRKVDSREVRVKVVLRLISLSRVLIRIIKLYARL